MASDNISVKKQDIATCITSYMSAVQKLNETVDTYRKALQNLQSDWTGKAFAIMAAKVTQMVTNLAKSYEKSMDAINELKETNQIFEQNESDLKSTFSNMDVGNSPFEN